MPFFNALTAIISVTELLNNITSIISNISGIMTPGQKTNRPYINNNQKVKIDKETYIFSTDSTTFHVPRDFGKLPVSESTMPIVFLQEQLVPQKQSLNIHGFSFQRFDNGAKIRKILADYAADSLILFSVEKAWNKTTLYSYILNIVPSHEGICYQFSFSFKGESKTGFIDDQIFSIMQLLLDHLSLTYYRLREEIAIKPDRLILELQILKCMGYDVELKETRNGYGMQLPFTTVSSNVLEYMQGIPDYVLIGISNHYPKEKPTIVLKRNSIWKKVDVDWCNNYTLGHIMRALVDGD